LVPGQSCEATFQEGAVVAKGRRRLPILLKRIESGVKLFGPGLRLPAYVIFFVTHRCDARCGHCFFWRQLNDRSYQELNLEEIDRLASVLGPVLQITLTGGSPELRHDLPEIAQVFHQRCQPANLTTCFNGYHTDRIARQVAEMLDRCSGQHFTAGVSLDGVGEEHDRLRGMPGLFDRVLRTIDELHHLKRETGRLQLICAVCISELNHETAERTVQWAREHLPVDFVKPILVRGKPHNPEALGCHAAKTYLRIVQSNTPTMRAGNLHWFNRLVLAKESVQRDLIVRISQTGVSPVRCSAARETAVVYADGSVSACELRQEKLGNLRDVNMDFARLWRDVAAQQFRESLRQRPCTCYHHCFLAPLIFRSPRLWFPLAKALVSLNSAARWSNSRTSFSSHH
jgi:MoaA/NifB/PqqE/SkfB family radical SAM enzyme